ncbi:protein of unassigned function [Methylobacterium oryzae CBMB20]|uniref:Protein of unassigned function n=1 Tax=Methylobacterium oryzae CBMB20 TaxID=693986 RepID=A0A089NXK2_9HYPH|nr:protein of unassigned function [Methylobacterium oryzae CBMB20]
MEDVRSANAACPALVEGPDAQVFGAQDFGPSVIARPFPSP